jgi:tetratricopeptide (TPR) repeat protein
MVTKMSAERIGHLVRNIEHLSSDTDHRGLVRFAHPQDNRYTSVIAKLMAMTTEAPQALQSRARSDYLRRGVRATRDTMSLVTMFLTIALLVLAVGLVPGRLIFDNDHLSLRHDYQGLIRFEYSKHLRSVSMTDKPEKMVAEAQQALQLQARSEQSSAPMKYLPFLQNKNFIGRTDELDTLERKLFVDKDCQKTAVVGLGGVGKTQLTLQFVYLVFEKHPDVSVFWIHSLSLETFEQACSEIARVLGIPGADDDKKDVKELVQRHLSAERAGKWMLVVDNADDIKVLEGFDGQKGILEYLPQSESGLTLFTARDKKTAHKLAGNSIVDVEKLDLATASDLFKKMLTRKDLPYGQAVVNKLLVELDCLPLAITQAAAYINVNPVSINEYLGSLAGIESNLVYIMSEDMGDQTRYKRAANAVAKTWLVSFDQIVLQDTDAANLLQYMSCIEWKAVPRSILPLIEPEARMTSAIGTLWSYSFITTRNDGQTYDMHRLVHVAARVWLHQRGMMAETSKRALEHLSDIFPSDDYENRERWREYIPHAARMRDAKEDSYGNARGRLCLKVGRCLRVDGRIRDAVGWLEESRDLRTNLPENHPDRLASQYELAMAYQANGQVKNAVRLLEHVVAIWERVLAEDHPDRLASQHALASAYQANGQVKEAVRLLEHVVMICERVLAEDHPDRLASQHELASAYQANGQVKDAVRLLGRVVTISEQVLADDHPDRLTSQHVLAMAYQANGQVKEAVRLLEEVVAIRERVQAEDHPHRLASQHALASAYQANGQVKEAVRLLEHVVAISERVLAEDHPDRLTSQHNLASAYQANGQVKEAVRLLEHVVAIRERVLEDDHSDRLASQGVLATAYQVNRQVKDAVRLLEEVVAIRERVQAEDRPGRLTSQHNLAMAYQANGQVKNAVRLLEHVVAIRERVLEDDHPDRLASQGVLASAYQANGQVEDVVRLFASDRQESGRER